MNILNIVSYAFFGLLLFGFFLGFFRSTKKSLARLILILISVCAAIFISPILSTFLISNFVDGNSISGFGFTLNFEKIINETFANENFNDILSASSTDTLITCIINVVINIISFLLLFIVLYILTLFIFWITSLIIRIANRKNEEYQEKREKSKSFGYRLGGGIIGIICSLIFFFALSIPIFGVMNIFDGFVSSNNSEQTASAHTNNLVCGNLYYNDNENIENIESYIEQYSNIKNNIDNSAIGKIANTIGLSSLGKETFNYLTTVEQNGLNFSLTNEIVSIINVYNIYKEGFIGNNIDLNNQESVSKALDSIENIYNSATNSSIVKSYLIELTPKMRERWLAGEKFLGLDFPIKGEYKDLCLIIVDKGFDTYLISDINNNMNSLINILRIFNDSGLIKTINTNEDIIEFFKQDENSVLKNTLYELSNSKFEEALPTMIEDIVKIAYKIVIDTNDILTSEEIDNIFENSNNNLPETIDWKIEGEYLENIIISSLNIADIFYSSETNSNLIINNLDKLGIVIDNARNSIFSNHFKIFVTKMINTKIDSDILGESTMDILTTKLDANWTNKNFKFEDMFNTIKQSALLIQNITTPENFENINLNGLVDNLESFIDNIVSNEQVKDTFSRIIDSGIIEQIIPSEHSETVSVVKDMIGSLINNTDSQSLKNDIAAGKEIINIVNISINNGTFSLEDETLSKENKASKIIETLTSSDSIMNVIKSATDDESSNQLKDIVSNISGDDFDIFKNSIESLSTESENIDEQTKNEEHKNLLLKLFDIN